MHNWRCLLIGRDSEKLKQAIAGLSGEHDYLALDITADDAAIQIARKAATMGGLTYSSTMRALMRWLGLLTFYQLI